MPLFFDTYTINDPIWSGVISYTSGLRARMNDAPTVNPQKFPSAGLLYHYSFGGGSGTGIPGYPNGIYGEPMFAEASPNTRSDSVLTLSLNHTAFRSRRLDRDFAYHAGDPLAGATITISIPSVLICHRGLYMGPPGGMPDGYIVDYDEGDRVVAFKNKSRNEEEFNENTGNVKVALMGIYDDGNGQLVPKLLWASSVSTETQGAAGSVSMDGTGFVRAYLDSLASGNPLFFEMMVLPHEMEEIDPSSQSNFADTMWDYHNGLLPFDAMTYDVPTSRDNGLLEWSDCYWSSIALQNGEVSYGGGFTLPSRCILNPVPHVRRFD